jgi:hypothetical protein
MKIRKKNSINLKKSESILKNIFGHILQVNDYIANPYYMTSPESLKRALTKSLIC